MSLNANKSTLILAGGVVVLGFYLAYKAKQTIKETANAINPANNKNIIAEATGSYELGSWVYCKFNSNSPICTGKY